MNSIISSLKMAQRELDTNPFAYLAHLAEASQVNLYKEEALSWITTKTDIRLFNSIFGIRLDTRNLRSNISLVLSHFSKCQRPCVWWLGPSTRPLNLDLQLEAMGSHHIDTVRLMACEIEKIAGLGPNKYELRIELVDNINLLKIWTKVYCHARGLTKSEEDDWFAILNSLEQSEQSALKHFVGFKNDQPVVCASLFLGGGVAGIYNVTTMPGNRKQGFGSSITKEAFKLAQEEGYEIAMLGAEPEAVKLYSKMGFKNCSEMKVFSW